MSLESETLAAFDHADMLGQATEYYRQRLGQREMAAAVAQTIESGGSLVVEAGTGVGKTFAYLVPALLSRERVMVSTATKALQDQLYGRDLPRLLSVLGLPARTALLKGRASYLCLHRLKQARQDHLPRHLLLTLAKIEKWALSTAQGDLAELPGLDERSAIIPIITSTRENCLGSTCPDYKNCHVMLARKQAMAADVVVVNHHLFFADLAVRQSGMAELLPSVKIAIFDEAHQLNETGIQFLGAALSSTQILDFCRDLLGTGLQLARGLADWQELARDCEKAARDLRLVVGDQTQYSRDLRLRWTGAAPEGLHEQRWSEALIYVEETLQTAATGLDTVSELAPDFGRLLARAKDMAAQAKNFLQAPALGHVRWLDVGQGLQLVEAPLDIAQTMREKLLQLSETRQPPTAEPNAFDSPSDADELEDSENWRDWMQSDEAAGQNAQSDVLPAQRSWIFTSATLGDDAQLSWFTEPCGLENARILQASSPFNYAVQAGLYIPAHLPKPSDSSHSPAVAALAAEAALRLGGRTLILTTTLRALKTIGQALQEQIGDQLRVLVQGQASKRELLDSFRSAEQDSPPGVNQGSVLVASASFWEGIDIPGDALQLVIIDKLPFPPPGDPLVEARCQRLENQGRSAFADYSVPEAAVALKQGAGRLIRRETDRGILVLCDVRLTQMSYGKRLLAALPPMKRLVNAEDFAQALDELSQASCAAK